MNSSLRLFLDFSPLAGFFLSYKFAGLATGTAVLVAMTLVSLVVTWVMEKKLSPMPLISGVIVSVMGGLTLYLHDDTFIKIKPTVVNTLFGSLLLGGVYTGRPMFKYVLGHAMSLTDEGWKRLSLRWGFFFLFLAALNEFIWRNFTTEFWVDFKVFGMLSLTMLFTFAQLPLIKRCWVDETPS